MDAVSNLRLFTRPGSVRNKLVHLIFWYAVAGIAGLLICGWWSYPVSAYLALLLFSFFYLHLLKVAPASALMMFPAFGGLALTQFISGIFIESGGYLSETKEMGSATGGFLRLAIIYVLFFGTAAYIIESYVERWRNNGQIAKFVIKDVRPFAPLVIIFNSIIFFGLAYLIYVGTTNGFPLLTGTDRFDFSQKLDNPIYLSIMGNRVTAMAYVGVMLAIGATPNLYRFMAVCVMVVSALLGDKFTEFIVIIGQLAGPSLCRVAWGTKGIPLRKIILMGLAMICITMPLVFVVYGGLSDSSEGMDRMKDRMTLQGQLWFLADREVKEPIKFEENPIVGELYMMVATEPTPKTARNKPVPYQGMAWLMLHFAPPSDAIARLKTGVVYCLGLHAYFLEILGWVGLVVLNFIFAVLLGLIISGVMYGLVYGRLVYLFFFAKFLTFWGATSVVADPFMLVNWKSFLFVLLLWLFHNIDKRINVATDKKADVNTISPAL